MLRNNLFISRPNSIEIARKDTTCTKKIRFNSQKIFEKFCILIFEEKR